MKSQKNSAQLFVVADTVNSGNVDAIADDKLGFECVLDSTGTKTPGEVFTVIPVHSAFKVIVPRANGISEVSDAVYTDDITEISINDADAVADVQQVDYLGYNPILGSGNIEALTDNIFTLNIKIIGDTMASFAAQTTIDASFKSGASTTPYAIALGLVEIGTGNLKYTPNDIVPIRFDIVAKHAGVALGTGVGTLRFTKGSKYFSASDIDNATTNAALAVGDFIRLGTTLSDGVYKIVELNATTNIGKLDRVASISKTGTQTSFKRITAATAASTSFGIKIIGLATISSPGYIDTYITRFFTSINGFGTTTVSREAVVAYKSAKTPEVIAQLEAELAGANGVIYRATPQYNGNRVSYVVNGVTYDTVHISFNKDYKNSFGETLKIPAEIIIAINSTKTAGLKTILASID